jgi:thiol:disulfide interchange protein DsbC
MLFLRNKYSLIIFLCILFLSGLLISPRISCAFSESGCDPDCKKCHTLNNQELNAILQKMNLSHTKVMSVKLSPAKGLWEVAIDDKGKKGVFYVDFSKKYIVVGNIIEIDTGENRTIPRPEPKKVDPSKIPLKDALVMGNKNASKKIIVFTDPDCPFCAKLHNEMKKVLDMRKDIAFYIKLFPLKMHKDAYWKSKSIMCKNSLKMLEDAFEKRPIDKIECNTTEVDDNIKLAESLGITGTPTIVFPDGRVHAGMVSAERLIGLIDKVESKKTVK